MSDKAEQKEKRKPPISYRPPSAREDEFYERYERSGLPSVSSFITHAVFEMYIPRKVSQLDRDLLRQILAAEGALCTAERKTYAEMGHIGRNMNQIAAAGWMDKPLANMHHQTLLEHQEWMERYKQSEIDRIQTRSALMQALGKEWPRNGGT